MRRILLHARALQAAALCLLCACTPSRGAPDDTGNGDNQGGANDPPGVLTITPGTVDVVITGSDQTVPLRATSKRYGDVTQSAQWTLSDASVGNIVAGKLAL